MQLQRRSQERGSANAGGDGEGSRRRRVGTATLAPCQREGQASAQLFLAASSIIDLTV